MITKTLPISEARLSELRKETADDQVLRKVIEFVKQGWPVESKVPSDVKPYFKLQSDVYVNDGLVFFEEKIVVPAKVRHAFVELVHKGHSGMNKSAALARELFYWPTLSKDVCDFVSKCAVCEKFAPATRKEALLPHSVPVLRFENVGADIASWGGKDYLVVIDHLSQWIEIRPLASKSSGAVINELQEVFTRYGYPKTLIADNNPFISYECKSYYSKHI